MTMIKRCEKVLRDTGVEMDADDVVAALMGHYARYRGGLTRDQVSGCLARLRASDDIDRTRPGLYQYRRAMLRVDYVRPAGTVQTFKPMPIPNGRSQPARCSCTRSAFDGRCRARRGSTWATGHRR